MTTALLFHNIKINLEYAINKNKDTITQNNELYLYGGSWLKVVLGNVQDTDENPVSFKSLSLNTVHEN